MKARDNPYRAERLEAMRYRFPDGDDMRAVLARLDRMGGRGAIIGLHGSGKTTLLRELGEALRGRGMRVRLHRLTQGARTWPHNWLADIDANDALLLDSAGLLSWSRWLSLRWRCRHAGVLVVTAHRRGLLPTLIRCRTSPALLSELLQDLGCPQPQSAQVFAAHRGNLHAVFRDLYLHAG